MPVKLIRQASLLVLLMTAFLWFEGQFGLVLPGTTRLHLRYVVTPQPEDDFRVEVRARGLSGRRPGFRLLDGWGILQDQPSYIEGVRAVDEDGRVIGVERKQHDGETTWELERRPRGELFLRYRVRAYPSTLSPEASFSDGEKFVLLGYSVFLQPRELRFRRRPDLSVEVVAPEDWPVWGSWPREGALFRPATTHDLWSGVAVGGDLRSSRLKLGAVSVNVLTERGIPDLTGLTIANRLLPVMREMHGLFGAPPRGDSLQVLALYRVLPPRDDNLSVLTGNSEEGAFLCLASPDRYTNADPLTVLATHECLHFYLGGAIAASPEPPFRNAPELVWLMEGTTEYLTFELLRRAGVIEDREMMRTIARKEKTFLETPGWPVYTLADAARRMEDIEVYGLVYSKGFLVGKLLHEEMNRRCGPGTFESALRELFEDYSYYRSGQVVDSELVKAVFASRCDGADDLIERYAEGTEPVLSHLFAGSAGEETPAPGRKAGTGGP